MQIKMTQRYHFLPIRLAKIQKFGNTFCCRSYGETSPVQLMGTQNGTIPLQGNWAKACKITIYVQAVTWEFHCWEHTPSFYYAERWKYRAFYYNSICNSKGLERRKMSISRGLWLSTQEDSDDKEQRSSRQTSVGGIAGQDVT